MSRLIKLWPVYGMLVVAAIAYYKGHAHGEAKAHVACLREKQEAVSRAIQQAEETGKANRKIADAYHNDSAKAKAEIRVVEKEVIRYVEDKHRGNDGCNLDADGVRLINDLIDIANGESAKDRPRVATAMSQAAVAGRRQ